MLYDFMFLQGAAVIIYSLLVAALLISATPKYKDRYYIITKIICSVSFIVIATIFSSATRHQTYLNMLLMPLVLCALGDVFMAIYNIKSKRLYIVMGIATFGLAHIWFVRLFVNLGINIGLFQLIGALVGLVALFMTKKIAHLHTGKLIVPICIYAAIISFMVASSISYVILKNTIASVWLVVAAVLFLISDYGVMVLYFRHFKSKVNKLRVHSINIITYYYAMLAFAISILYIAL